MRWFGLYELLTLHLPFNCVFRARPLSRILCYIEPLLLSLLSQVLHSFLCSLHPLTTCFRLMLPLLSLAASSTSRLVIRLRAFIGVVEALYSRPNSCAAFFLWLVFLQPRRTVSNIDSIVFLARAKIARVEIRLDLRDILM
jgi:hypothetical protein